MLTTDGYYCIARGGRHGEPCPPGTYPTDGGLVCMGAARTSVPGATPADLCIEGFTYDAAFGCCRAPGGEYPGCGSGEYFDTVHGCQTGPDATGTLITAITFNVSTGACGGPDGGGDTPCSGIVGDATTITIQASRLVCRIDVIGFPCTYGKPFRSKGIVHGWMLPAGDDSCGCERTIPPVGWN
jgi:hypothetical protein